MEKQLLRAAIIGCGCIAGTHAANLAAGDYARLVAFCDIDPAKAAAYRDEFAKEAQVFTDWREMLSVCKPDVVHITTPHDLHAEMAIECLSRGIHVYLEKPISISEEELAALEAAAAASSAKITISFQNRRIALNRLFFRLIEEEGGAVAARGQVAWNRGEAYYTADDWHGRLAREGGGAMINQAIHTLDLLVQSFSSAPCAVTGKAMLLKNGAFSEVEDNAHFLVDFKDGGTLVFSATTNYPTDAYVYYEVLTKSGARLTGMENHLYRNGVRVDTDEQLAPLFGKACWGAGHTICIREFYTAIAEGGEVPCTLASAAKTMRILFALYRGKDGAQALL